MCGLNCIVGTPDSDRLRRMSSATEHRGPDQCGFYENESVSFNVNRLSIIDPTNAGKQPMHFNEYTIAYNGEVYNHTEIRNSLQDEGYMFNSQTDTEVILKGYDNWGNNIFKMLNGMFGIVIYNRNKNKIICIRDKIGIKPLYYYMTDDGMAISSETKAIIAAYSEETSFRIDGSAVHEYFSTRRVSTDSMFENINIINPGELVTFDLGSHSLTKTKFLSIYEYINSRKYSQIDESRTETLVDELDTLLNEAVKRQIVADAPVATICSGGVDSSLLTAIATQYHPELKAYHVNVVGDEYSETQYAETVADYLDVDLRKRTLDQELFNDLIEDSIYYNDMPLLHPNSVGVAAVSELAANDGIKVLLTGEGADEVFGGYRKYLNLYWSLLGNHLNILKTLLHEYGPSRAIPFFLHPSVNSVLEPFLTDSNRFDLLNPVAETRMESVEEIMKKYDFIDSEVYRSTRSYLTSDLNHYLQTLLHRADRMSMMMGVEARVPFLDEKIVEFGVNLPKHCLFNRRSYFQKMPDCKYLLKCVAERYLPDEIVHRNKVGFGLPPSWWRDGESDSETGEYKSIFYDIWSSRLHSDVRTV